MTDEQNTAAASQGQATATEAEPTTRNVAHAHKQHLEQERALNRIDLTVPPESPANGVLSCLAPLWRSCRLVPRHVAGDRSGDMQVRGRARVATVLAVRRSGRPESNFESRTERATRLE